MLNCYRRKPCRGDPAVVSKFSKGWKDRLIYWGYICAFEAFLNITILYYTFFSFHVGCKLVDEESWNVHIVKLKLFHTESRTINSK